MRFSSLLPILLPLIVLCAEENVLLENIRKSLDGMETDTARIHWDAQGFRVEEKNWWEKSADWMNTFFAGNQRVKRHLKGQKEVDNTEDELIRVNAKIVFYKNGTRMVDIENGPLISVNPKGQIQVDFRNGTVQRLGGSRIKRFARLDDLYMAHGYEMEQRNAEDFGRDMDGQKGEGEGAGMNRADSSGEEEEGEGGGGPEWAEMAMPKDPYWDRPLYGGPGREQIDFGTRHQQKQEQGHVQTMGQGQGEWKPAQARPIVKRPSIWEQSETPSILGPMPQSGQRKWPNSRQNPIPPKGTRSQQRQNAFRSREVPLPPSPSPSSWAQSRLHSQQPISPEELALAKELLRRMNEEGRIGGSNGGKPESVGNGGKAGERKEKQQTAGTGKSQGPKAPEWAQPKNG